MKIHVFNKCNIVELQENNFFRLFPNNIPEIVQFIHSKIILNASKIAKSSVILK